VQASKAFILQSATFLQSDFFPRIRTVVEPLSDEQVWWRPNDASNSIGNLLLHLDGNVTQWILGGVGGVSVMRDRPREFAERSLIPSAELLTHLHGTIEQAGDVLSRLDPALLLDTRTIQGNDVTILEAVYHVVEHFSMHTGQILMLAKMMTGKDLHLYMFPDGAARKAW
jgi:uncharacterized damage-inducible protein DinB